MCCTSAPRARSNCSKPGPLEKKRITAEACVHHLWFSDADYAKKGALSKWNPAVKSAEDRAAIRQAVMDGRIDVVATDHAPHTLEEKALPYAKCPSGGPLIQHSLVAMLELEQQGVFTLAQVVEKLSMRRRACSRWIIVATSVKGITPILCSWTARRHGPWRRPTCSTNVAGHRSKGNVSLHRWCARG
jgi:hypothetical protein